MSAMPCDRVIAITRTSSRPLRTRGRELDSMMHEFPVKTAGGSEGHALSVSVRIAVPAKGDYWFDVCVDERPSAETKGTTDSDKSDATGETESAFNSPRRESSERSPREASEMRTCIRPPSALALSCVSSARSQRTGTNQSSNSWSLILPARYSARCC